MSNTEQTLSITDTIRAIWINRPSYDGHKSIWMSLTHLRRTLDSYEDVTWSRAEVDEALADMMTGRTARIIPESAQHLLTDADRDAALVTCGKHRHHITIVK